MSNQSRTICFSLTIELPDDYIETLTGFEDILKALENLLISKGFDLYDSEIIEEDL